MAWDSGHGPVRSDDRWWRSLAARGGLTVGAAFSILAALLIVSNVSAVRRDATRAIEASAAAGAERIASAIDKKSLDAGRFADLTAAQDYVYAVVQAASGATLAGATPPAGVPDLLPQGIAESGSAAMTLMLSRGGIAHVARTVAPLGQRPATLRLGLSLAPADAAASDAGAQGVLIAVVFLVLALPALAVLFDRAAAPIRALTRAVTRPGSAQEAVREAGERRDEVGALARAHISIARDLAVNADALHRLTFDDPLTRLPNRESLISRLASALQLGQPVALLMFEIEGLSRVAAGLGQQQGDDAIKAAALRLGEIADQWTKRAGLGGDRPVLLARTSDSSFALIARGAGAMSAKSLADATLEGFQSPLAVAEHRVAATVTVGVALGPEHGDEAGALLRSAAAAVSAARSAGPNTVRFAGPELNRMAYGRLKLEQDLRRAIEHGELELNFQPQIALKSGATSGAEALVRWRHPVRGMVSPADFVPVAEECGLVDPLGRFVLTQASRTISAWGALGMPIRMAVNVSPIEFRRAKFAATMLGIIEAAGANPSQIELEITESAAMGDPDHAARELAPLKEAGVTIAVDDFGTGYSNLAALTRLPFDVLKIDRGFIRDAVNEAGARVVVGTVIGMAENLGFETVAEGVETEQQRAFVMSHGCGFAQGYLFGRPMPAAAFEVWHAERLVANLREIGERSVRVGDRPVAMAH